MRIFVAGATGVLGRALVTQLVAARHDVRGMARRLPAGALPVGVELIQADLLEDDLAAIVRDCDAVVHIATAMPSDPCAAGAWERNGRVRIEGTRRLLDAAVACRVPRYLQQSIVMAYRDGGDDWLDEEAPLDDSPARAAICGPVIEMEAILRKTEPQLIAWTILRGGSFVGAGMGQAMIDALRAGEVTVAGDGSNYLSPVTVGDMASAVAAAVGTAPAGSTFNIVDEPLRYGDYVDALADLVGAARPPRAPKLALPPSWRCSNEAARTVLRWMPRERIWPYADSGHDRFPRWSPKV